MGTLDIDCATIMDKLATAADLELQAFRLKREAAEIKYRIMKTHSAVYTIQLNVVNRVVGYSLNIENESDAIAWLMHHDPQFNYRTTYQNGENHTQQ